MLPDMISVSCIAVGLSRDILNVSTCRMSRHGKYQSHLTLLAAPLLPAKIETKSVHIYFCIFTLLVYFLC